MATFVGQDPALTFLGIECGATRTVALLADGAWRERERVVAGPANFKLLTPEERLAHFQSLAARFETPAAVGIGMAGARADREWEEIRATAQQVWPGVPCRARHDLETALAAAGVPGMLAPHRILILSGTGSCCYGRRTDGRTAKVGGWGHVLGDQGSGYALGLEALRSLVRQYDETGLWPLFGRRVLTALHLTEPNQLIAWAQTASKPAVAALAPLVFECRQTSRNVLGEAVERAAHELARDAIACARRLELVDRRVELILAGSVLLHQPWFARWVSEEVTATVRKGVPRLLERPSVWGAVMLAWEALDEVRMLGVWPEGAAASSGQDAAASAGCGLRAPLLPTPTGPAPTETRNPRSMELDRLPLGKAVALFLREERRVTAALMRERKAIESAVRLIARALTRGGRLFYVGAGTSGRLGVLDASECPPTFGTPPDLVQGIMAGGPAAVLSSVEGAEDDHGAGARAVDLRGVDGRDVVVGIAASGRTPFVWGALATAKERGAATVLVCFNPRLRFPAATRPRVVIVPDTGPELLTGSTRLKAGTATKLLLNLFSTLAMTKLGKVVSNLMVDVQPSNVKLRARAVRIVQELTGAEEAAARAALETSGWVVKKAWCRLAGGGGVRGRRARR